MKRLRYLVSIWCLLAALGVGVTLLAVSEKAAVASVTENRMLQAFPELTGRSLAEGVFSTEFEAFLSDKFFARDAVTSWTADVKDLFSLLTEEDMLQLVALHNGEDDADILAEQARGEGALPVADPQQIAAAEVTVPDAETDAAVPAPSVETDADAPVPSAETDAEATVPGAETDAEAAVADIDAVVPAAADVAEVSLLLVKKDGTKTPQYRHPTENVRELAAVLNRLLALLPEDGNMFFTLAPRGENVLEMTLYPEDCVRIESELEPYLAQYTDPRIRIVSAADILSPHILAGEYVYYRTDLHWTPLGAYYVAEAMLSEQGIPIIPYADYGWVRQAKPYLGSIYTRDQFDTALLKTMPDTVDNIVPVMPYRFCQVNYLTWLTDRPLVTNANGYRAYLGGNIGPWRVMLSGINTGRRALVVCDSMGNVFSPYLMAAYDQVHVLCPKAGSYDPVEAGGRVKDFIDEYGIDDVYVVSTTFTVSESYRQYLNHYLGD